MQSVPGGVKFGPKHAAVMQWAAIDCSLCSCFAVCSPGPGCQERPSLSGQDSEDLWLRTGPRHHAWQQLRLQRKCKSPFLHERHFSIHLFSLQMVEYILCHCTDLPAGEVDGTREYFWQPVHHTQWCLVLRHPALGDILLRWAKVF